MNIKQKTFIYVIYMLYMYVGVSAQNDTIYMSMTEAENLFFRQNLELIAENLNIDKAEAAVVQAKLLPNPVFSIDQVNLWTTDEFAVNVEQFIQLAGKRRKLVAAEQVSKNIAGLYFEELLVNLKIELRGACVNLQYFQEYKKVLENQLTCLDRLVENQRTQTAQGNVSKSRLLRIQASALEIRSEYNATLQEINRLQKNLKILLNVISPAFIVISDIAVPTKSPDELVYDELVEIALAERPEAKAALYQVDYYEKMLKYEKSQRVPDITLKAGYDRAGGVVANFTGFGLGIDLPFFNRNQGNIKAARANAKQSAVEAENRQLVIRHEIGEALQNYRLAYDFAKHIDDRYISDLDEMLKNYTVNFYEKNIGIVEFLDFFDVYKENKRMALDAKRELSEKYNQLKIND